MTANQASAQDVVTIERFESAKGVTIDGQQIRKVYNARFRMGEVTMVCDSAWQFIGQDEMRAFGNIQIDTETENIWADTLYYYTNEDLSLLRGRVIIKQDSSTLFGKKVDYNFLTKVAYFRNGIRLEDPDGVLTALTGVYFQNQDSAVFRQQVQLEDSAQYAEGDSLFINREREYLQLYSNLLVADSTDNALLTGEYLEADSTGRRYLEGNAYLRKIEIDTTFTDSLSPPEIAGDTTDSLMPPPEFPFAKKDTGNIIRPGMPVMFTPGDSASVRKDSASFTTTSDTTHINASRILLLKQDSTSLIRAYEEVRVWTAKFSSLSDSLFYNSQTELFKLMGKPRAWHQDIQLNGPFISVQLDSGDVKELRSYIGAFAVQKDSATGRLHQLKGDTLIAWFDNGDVSRIKMFPNSQILYHTKNDTDEPDGAMESSSPTTTLFFEKGELMRALMGQNQGLFLPEYEGLMNRKLDGFQWNPELRPQKPASEPVPRWEPIPRERPFSLPERYIRFISTDSETGE